MRSSLSNKFSIEQAQKAAASRAKAASQSSNRLKTGYGSMYTQRSQPAHPKAGQKVNIKKEKQKKAIQCEVDLTSQKSEDAKSEISSAVFKRVSIVASTMQA